jgi:RimJ/RimL family protein N-acetyltransferase
VTVETARLLLRVPRAADANAFLEIHQDPEVIELKQVTLTEPPGGIDLALRNVERMLRHWSKRGYGQWAVTERATGDVIGSVGFYNPEGWPGIDLGWIFHRSRWGNGFATEAAHAALQWAWQTENIDHVISLIAPNDLRSIRIATKIGQGFERADVDPIHGEPVVVYGIHRPEHRSGGI